MISQGVRADELVFDICFTLITASTVELCA